MLGTLIPFGHEYWPTLYDVVDLREEYTVENLHPDVIARLRPQLDAVAAEVAAEEARRAQAGTPSGARRHSPGRPQGR